VVTQPTTFIQWLRCFRNCHPKDAWILDELELVGDHSDIIKSIHDGTVCAISDGSFKDKHGATAFTIMCPKTKAAYTGQHTVQGPLSANSAYQSKLLGILGIQTLANLLCLHDDITLGGVTLAYDGLSGPASVLLRWTSCHYQAGFRFHPFHSTPPQIQQASMDQPARQRSSRGY
jgi:hypothetical protein